MCKKNFMVGNLCLFGASIITAVMCIVAFMTGWSLLALVSLPIYMTVVFTILSERPISVDNTMLMTTLIFTSIIFFGLFLRG